MIENRAETLEEWYTIIKDTVNKYTVLKENLQKENNDQNQANYKKILSNYDEILKQYSHYLK